MPHDELDPGASTQMFQAFVDSPEPEESGTRWLLPAVAVTVALVVMLALGWFLLGG